MKNISCEDSEQWREEQRRRKRQAVLQASAKLFSDRGYYRTSLDDIAEALNVTKRTLYYYVQGKEEILFECCRQALRLMDDALERCREKDEPVLERIQLLLTKYVELMATDLGAALVLTNDGSLSADNREALAMGKRDLIRAGINDGSISDFDAKLAAAAIFGALNWIPRWNTGYSPIPDYVIAGQYIDLLMGGLTARST